MPENVRVILSICHTLFLAGIDALLERECGIKVVGEGNCKDSCYKEYFRLSPDVLVMEISFGKHYCLDAIQHILAKDPKASILVLNSRSDDMITSHVLRMGAKGYLTNTSPADMLIHAIHELSQDRMFIEPETAQHMAADKIAGNENSFTRLTHQEYKIFLMLVDGSSVVEIANELRLSSKTIANYHTQVLHKLNVTNHVELTKLAIRHNIIDY